MTEPMKMPANAPALSEDFPLGGGDKGGGGGDDGGGKSGGGAGVAAGQVVYVSFLGVPQAEVELGIMLRSCEEAARASHEVERAGRAAFMSVHMAAVTRVEFPCPA